MNATEKELDAAEYVIGTLSDVERKAFEDAIESDGNTRAQVAFWERAFGALNASVAPEPVPADLWAKIEGRLPSADTPSLAAAGLASVVSSEEAARRMAKVEAAPVTQPAPQIRPKSAANDNRIAQLQKSLRRWRLGGVAAAVAALALGAFIVYERAGLVPGQTPEIVADSGQQFVAVVNANGDQPSLLVNVDVKTGDISVRSLGIERPDDKSLELWYVPEGQKPVSIGLVGEGVIDLKDLKANGGDLLAVSLEPKGGSPTGTATGPVIYTGKLVSLPE
ncbi:MAG: anti-sigma factor [Pseudomonadota bacterium]